MTGEFAVAAGMLHDPGRNVPIAWGLLRSDDFQHWAPRLVYDALTAFWSHCEECSGGDYGDGLAYEVVALYARDTHPCSARDRKPAVHIDDAYDAMDLIAKEHQWHLFDEGPAEHRAAGVCFGAHCSDLAAEGAVRRVRDRLATWHQTLCGDEKDGVTARKVLAGVLREIRGELRASERPGAVSGVPKVGVW